MGPITEQSKSSDLDCGWGDLGSNPGEGMCFFRDGEVSGSHTKIPVLTFHLGNSTEQRSSLMQNNI